MPPIVTLTLNPALDVTTHVAEVIPTHKLRCGPPHFDPGGGGINVARVIHALGGDVTAVFPCGGPAGATIATLLRDAGVPAEPVAIAGATRESMTVDEDRGGRQFRFVLPGPALTEAEIEAVITATVDRNPAPAYVVASGSLPPGCDPAIYAAMAHRARARGARFVLDTSGPALAASARAGAFLLKPSLRELEELEGRPLGDAGSRGDAAMRLIGGGYAEHVLLSLGAEGALLATGDATLTFPAISVRVRSTVGAGDSMVAAVTLALSRGWPIEAAVRYGIAAGAAALRSDATGLADPVDVERLYAEAAC